MKNLKSRMGKLVFDENLKQASSKQLKAIFSNFYPLDIEHIRYSGTSIYYGCSEHFREIEEGEMIPEYIIIIEHTKEGKVIFDTMKEVEL